MNLWLQPHTRPLIVGHRGASALAPENTLAAFRLARTQGADAIELDAKRCATGEVVIMHDATLNRTTNGNGGVHEHTLAHLMTLDAGQGERIPTLDDVLEVVGRDLLVNVEVTNYSTIGDGLEEKVVEVVRRHHMEQGVLFSTFNPLSVQQLAELAPDIPRAFLYGDDTPSELRRALRQPFVPHEFEHPSYSLVTPQLVGELAQHQIKVNVWTVNDRTEIRRVADCAVHGIIGDSPQTIREVLGV